MAGEMSVQEQMLKAWCDSWAPGTYDRLTEAEKQDLRDLRARMAAARRQALSEFASIGPIPPERLFKL